MRILSTSSWYSSTPKGSGREIEWQKVLPLAKVSVWSITSCVDWFRARPKEMVPISSGVGLAVGSLLADAGTSDGDAVTLGEGVGDVDAITAGASGSIPDRTSPKTMARPIVASAAPIETRESRSVGTRPDGGGEPAPPGRIGTPQDRQTCAQEGFARPQLKHSTLSPVMGAQPSMRAPAESPALGTALASSGRATDC